MLKLRKRKNESTNDFIERASKIYYNEGGYHIKEIAEILGVDEIEVYNIVANGRKITTNDERSRMIQLYNQGYSYSAIGRIFNKSHSCVKERIEHPAKMSYNNSNKLTKKQLDKMKEMIEDGYSIEDISKEIKISTSSITYRLSHTNLREQITHVSKSEKNKFIRLRKKGKSYSEIARICNRSRNTVSRHLHNAGY